MDKAPTDYRVEFTVRNNRILYFMRQMGFTSVADLCRASGLSQSEVGRLVNLKRPAVRRDTHEWTPTARRLAEALCCEPDDLWTDAQRVAAMESNRRSVELTESQMKGFFLNAPVQPDEVLQLVERSDQLERAVKTLTPREENVLRMRFGLKPYFREYTLEQIGEQFKVTRDRIRQIEQKALRKLRHPSRWPREKPLDTPG